MPSLADKVEDLAEGLIIASIVIGGIAVRIFLDVNTTGMGATELLAWSSVITLALAGLAIGFIRHMRAGKKR